VTTVARPSLSPGTGDEQVTAERDETKYLLPADRLEGLAAALTNRMAPHRFTGEGSNRLPGAHHFITTVYFDTPSRAHLRAAAADPDRSVKIRAKEYYDIHPSLAELATDPKQIVRYQPWLWFELKRREGIHTSKRRFRLPKADVPSFFAEGRVTPQARDGQADQQVELQEIADYCKSQGDHLAATCLVNYRRLSWQEPDGTLRVTMDLGLAYYAAPPDLWTRRQALVRSTLGPVRGKEPRAVIEVKRVAPVPAWLEEALAQSGAMPDRFSKFVAAGQTVWGDG
jgi:hypothetical protein